jgi:hypothetical protein
MSTDTPSAPPSIPDKQWTNPFQDGTWLQEEFEEVLEENRDIIFLIDDLYGRRGTGKTIASLQLGNSIDQTPEGLTWEKCSLRPEEIRNAYETQPKGSALVLDEAEWGASNRNAMSKTNQMLREIFSMGRVEQKYIIVNAPIKGFIDRDIQKLSTAWVSMVRRGRALVHEFRWEAYSEQLLTPKKQWLDFYDIPRDHELRTVYNKLTREKRKIIRGGEGGGYVPRDEHNEALASARKETRKEVRNEIIQGVLQHPEHQESNHINQRTVGESVGLTQQAVSNIIRNGNDD